MRTPEKELRQFKAEGLLRRLNIRETCSLPSLKDESGCPLLNFSSNDYLGLSRHPALVEAAVRASQAHGTGAAASRLVCGSFRYHHELEEKIATLKETESARLFANGYATALGSIPALVQKGDIIILDKLSHACLIDAARLSGATIRVFPHNNLNRLEDILKKVTSKTSQDSRVLVVTESIFSMDGDACPLAKLVELKDQYGALLFLDEAHGLGVLGPTGMGLAEEKELQSRIDFQMGTLGKAAGSAGGYLATSRVWNDLLVNRARSFIYSTAPPPAQVAAASAALEIITSAEGESLRSQLQQNLTLLQGELSHQFQSAIVPYILGENEKALLAAEELLAKGLLVPAIRYPTVPRKTARLRITLSAAHTAEQVKTLKSALKDLSP